MKKVELGDEVECQITGFRGIANGKSQWLTGCDRISVQGPIGKDGKYGESFWVDEAALRIIKKQKVKPENVREEIKKGGPTIRINNDRMSK